jgi:FRG domain
MEMTSTGSLPSASSGWAPHVGKTLQPDTWSDCLHLLLSSGDEDALYRGHGCFEWALQSSLERALLEHARKYETRALVMESMADDPETTRWALGVESALTQRFRHQATRMRLPNLPPAWDTLGWWEVMQHNGAPTRLIDWTRSFFVALWFAVEKDHEDGSGDMALWVYDRHIPRVNLHLEGLTQKLQESEDYEQLDDRRIQNALVKLALEDGENGLDLLIPITPRQFPRAVAQQSVLTVSRTVAAGLPASQWIKSQLATRVRLKEEWRPDIQAACRSAGLSRLNLFRDLDSLGKDVREIFINSQEIPDTL